MSSRKIWTGVMHLVLSLVMSVWSVDEAGNVDYTEATQHFLVEIT